LLNAVQENARVSQRSLAGELGIALGLTNAYLKRCVRKGLVKVAHVPANRYAYYLTPKGFSEKSRLTASYLKRSFDFYREARTQCDEALAICAAQGWSRMALAGAGELAEIALLCALQQDVEIVGVIDARRGGDNILNVPLVGKFSDLETIDAVLLTDSAGPQRTFDDLADVLPAERFLVPALLGVTRPRDPEDDPRGSASGP
jgi:DNA-binding MarR family transcriptional regulator